MRDEPADQELLDRLQRSAFEYLLAYANPANGLVADTSRPGSPASIAVVGFALSCYPVAVEAGWVTRADAAALRVIAAFTTISSTCDPASGCRHANCR